MSELKSVKQSDVMWGHWFTEFYVASDVNAVLSAKDKEIVELKAKIIKSKELADGIRCDIEKVKADAAETLALLEERNRQVGELKHSLELASNECCSISERAVKNERRLKRALWIARASRAIEKIAWFRLWCASISTMNPEDGARQEYDRWKKALGKFLAKAEEYK